MHTLSILVKCFPVPKWKKYFWKGFTGVFIWVNKYKYIAGKCKVTGTHWKKIALFPERMAIFLAVCLFPHNGITLKLNLAWHYTTSNVVIEVGAKGHTVLIFPWVTWWYRVVKTSSSSGKSAAYSCWMKWCVILWCQHRRRGLTIRPGRKCLVVKANGKLSQEMSMTCTGYGVWSFLPPHTRTRIHSLLHTISPPLPLLLQAGFFICHLRLLY